MKQAIPQGWVLPGSVTMKLSIIKERPVLYDADGNQFRALWRYTFYPKKYFLTKNPPIGKYPDLELPEPTSYFYLCGVASGPRSQRGKNNLHLAVRPKSGSVATIQSVYGPTLTIHNAEEIAIQDPIQDLPHLDESYTTCKNFRFAAQMYEATSFGPEARGNLVRTPRER
jgi:hypothetical protein